MNPYTESTLIGCKNAQFVFLHKTKLRKVAAELARQSFPLPSWRESVFPENDRQFVEFIFVANAINYCYLDPISKKKFDVEYPTDSGKIWTGSMAMAAALKRALDEGIPILDRNFLCDLTYASIQHIFRPVTTEMPLLKERLLHLRSLREACYHLVGEHGKFGDIFYKADYRAFNKGLGVVERICMLPGFRDICYYRGQRLEFHKRAMLLAMVYHGRAMSRFSILRPLKDPESLGPIADYQVPKTLRHFGILSYVAPLSLLVRSKTEIPKGSQMEIEIRSQTVHAICLLLKEINALRSQKITMAELDYKMWSLGRSLGSLPHHYTVTTAY